MMNCVCAELLQVRVRWVKPEDLDHVYDMEKRVSPSPWTPLEFARLLNHPHCVCMVAEYEGDIIGYILYELNARSFKIWNLVVLPQYQRRGVGSQMIARVACRLDGVGKNSIRLEVRESNLPAQLFFRSLGFQAVSINHGTFDDTHEDAYLMQYRYRSRARLVAA